MSTENIAMEYYLQTCSVPIRSSIRLATSNINELQ